jgi:hypothetical protein
MYSYGDVEVWGKITCEVDDIFIVISGIPDCLNCPLYTGKHNRETQRLIWENIEYGN